MRLSATGLIIRLIVATLTLGLASTWALAAKRVALVIGNSEYEHTSALRNPVNDANLMASSLEKAGFEVTKVIDADYRTLKKAMLNFGRALRNGPDAGLFYYAGHGIQVRGKNYLIPVNAKISDEDEVDLEAIDVNSFLQVMESSQSNINIIILDACRNNPFARSFRSATQGLASVDAPKGTYISYATAPGKVAADGFGKNSPFTTALAREINIPGQTIEQVFKKTRVSVLSETQQKQLPWDTSSITGNFYFHDPVKVVEQKKPVVNTPVIQQPQQIIQVPVANNEAESVYKQIKDSENIEMLEIFAKQYPDSIYTRFVKVRIKSLKAQQKTKTALLNENSNNNNIRNNDQRDNNDSNDRSNVIADDNLREGSTGEQGRINVRRTIRNVQAELNRLGCEAGSVDGQWGRTSKNALQRFQDHSSVRLSGLEPLPSTLKKLREYDGTICPVKCDAGFTLRNGQCVRVSVEDQIASSGCRDLYSKFRKNGPIRAFALSDNGKHCGTSWNYNTKSEATSSALKYCKQDGGSNCRVVSITNPASRPESKECKDLFRKWKRQKGRKAFAVSGSGQACGYGANYGNKREAINRALAECRKQNYKGCHVIASAR